MTYSYSDLLQAYRDVGVMPGQLVYATSDLMGVADFETRGSGPLAEAHFQALQVLQGVRIRSAGPVELRSELCLGRFELLPQVLDFSLRESQGRSNRLLLHLVGCHLLLQSE